MIKIITKNKFIQNVIILVSGTALSQLITIAFSPVITRLYGPEAFGVLGVFTSLMSILTPIVALAYPIAIVLPQEDEEAKGLMKLSLGISIGFSIVVTVLLFVFGDWLLEKLSMSEIDPFIMIIPIYLMLSACVQVARQWLIRKKQFKTTAHVSVVQSLFLGGSKTGVGFISPGSGPLIILTVIGEFFHCILFWIGVFKTRFNHRPIHDIEHNPISIKQVAKDYKDFPLYRAPQVTINALSQSLPTIFLISFFGPASAGFFSLGKRLLGLPSTLIANSVGEVFYPRISEAALREENLSKLILKATFSLAGVGILPYTIIAIFGPWLFSFVFGPEWEPAGIYARWLSIYLFFSFINKPSVKALPVLRAQRFHLILTIVIVILQLAAMYVGFFIYKSDVVAIILYSFSGVISNLFLIAFVFFFSKNYKYCASVL